MNVSYRTGCQVLVVSHTHARCSPKTLQARVLQQEIYQEKMFFNGAAWSHCVQPDKAVKNFFSVISRTLPAQKWF